MIHILAATRNRFEFATADAINEAGGIAIVPRRVWFDTEGATNFAPFLPGYIFLALSEAQWHEFHNGPLYAPKYRNGEAIGRAILPPFRKVLDILPRTWADFQGFAARAEAECLRRIDQHETGLKAAKYRKGDRLRIFGDLMYGQLRDHIAEFQRLDPQGRVIATVPSVTMLGKPMTVTLQPGQVEAV